MAVAYRSSSSTHGTGTDVTPAEPAGAAQGDVLTALCIAFAATITIPSGWTSIYSGAASSYNYNLCRIVRGATAPSYTFGISASVFRQASIVCKSGADGATPYSATATTGYLTATNPDPPSASPGTVDGLSLAVCAHNESANPFVAPTGYTLVGNTALSDIGMAYKLLSSTAAENPAAFTGPAAIGDVVAFTLLVQPSSVTSPSAPSAGTGGGDVTQSQRRIAIASYTG